MKKFDTFREIIAVLVESKLSMIAFLLIAFCNVVSPFNSESVVEAEDLCDDYICVNGREKDGEVVFYLSNRQSVPITVSVAVELENMTSSVKLPYTITLRKFGYERAFRIFPRNRKLPSKFNVKSSWVFGVKGAVHDESTVYQLPFPKDKKYILSQGPFSDSSHKGKYAYDFGMPEGSRVLAARAGKVVGVEDRHERSGSEAEYAEFNNFVFIEHNDGTIGKYLHLKKGGARVELGSSVKAGDLLGLSGSVGRSNGPHLHFEVVSAIDGYRDKTFPLHFELERRGVISLVDGDECIPPVNRAW